MNVLLHEGHTNTAAATASAGTDTMVVTTLGLVLTAVVLGYAVKRVTGA